MKDTTQTITNDSTSNKNNGIKRGIGEPLETPAKIGKGQYYDGTNDYINAGNDNSLELDTFTISAWINPKRLAWCNMIIGKYYSSALGEWYLSFSATTPYNKLRTVIIVADGRYQWLESATSITTDKWTHITLVYDGTISFYINGIKDPNIRTINKNIRSLI